MIPKKKQVIIGLLIPLLILVAMTITPLLTVLFGRDVILETEPYDPRDLFRGDYVRLHYRIDQINIDKFSSDIRENPSHYKDKYLYILLKEKADSHVVDHVSAEKPKEQLYLKGKLRDPYQFERIQTENQGISLVFSLDKFFVPENTGSGLEDLSRKGDLLARVKVFGGYAYLEEVFPKNI